MTIPEIRNELVGIAETLARVISELTTLADIIAKLTAALEVNKPIHSAPKVPQKKNLELAEVRTLLVKPLLESHGYQKLVRGQGRVLRGTHGESGGTGMNDALLSPSASHEWTAHPPSARLIKFLANTKSSYTAEGTIAHSVTEGKLNHLLGRANAPLDCECTEMDEYTSDYANFVLEQAADLQNPVLFVAWISDIKHWDNKDIVFIQEDETILPTVLFNDLPPNLKNLCKQIHASYEHNLFDCTAVMMRRLLESLLVLAYQNNGIEAEIMGKGGTHHITLDKIIKNAEQNTTLMLSGNTKSELSLFKNLGNYSAHKIWYNCTQQDIKPHILKYRAITEELIYKAGLK